MTSIRLIGDVHGDWDAYQRAIDGHSNTIQVGDYGIGFGMPPPNDNHKFIRGNHDNPSLCKSTKGWIRDGSYDIETGIFFIGGAWSIDWNIRQEGLDWWRDEELCTQEFLEIFQLYRKVKPRIVVTHDGPVSALIQLIYENKLDKQRWLKLTRTNMFLEEFLNEHKPEKWFFGHHHVSWCSKIRGTSFRCLTCNETYDLEI